MLQKFFLGRNGKDDSMSKLLDDCFAVFSLLAHTSRLTLFPKVLKYILLNLKILLVFLYFGVFS